MDPADGRPHTKLCFLQHYGVDVGAQKWATAAPWVAAVPPEAPAAKCKGKGEPKRKCKGEPKREVRKRKVEEGCSMLLQTTSHGIRKRNSVTGSRGGGRQREPGVQRKSVHIRCDINGIPQFILTVGAEKDVENVRFALIHYATEVDTSPDKPHQPFLGIHSFKMREDIVDTLFPTKKTRRSVNQFFSQMGFRYKTVDCIKVFTFNVDCYKENGWKVHRGSGSKAPEIFFDTSPP